MSVVYSQSLKYSEGEIRRNPEIMDSNSNICQTQHNNSGLLRYRSAPSSLLTTLVDNNNSNNNIGCVNNDEAFRNSEMETMFAKLISSSNGFNNSEPLNDQFGGKPVVKTEDFVSVSQQNGYSSYQNHQIQCLNNNGSFSAMSSLASDNSSQTKMSSSNCNNLISQKSSPAGFFSNYSVDNGLTSTSSGLNCTLNFSSRPSSCSSRMPQIDENGSEGIEANCTVQNRNLGNENGSTRTSYMPSNSFTTEFWDNSSIYSAATNRGEIMFSTTSNNALDTQNTEFGYQKLGLSHHLSLPSSSTKIGSMEKYYQIQGSVPCKIRAKRGFATHPRSIAERERRTRISTRIKKLQDIFPKSDKQTSTADMLDLAVEYIKDLQKQVKILTDIKAKCTCTSNQKQYSRPNCA